MFDLYAVRLKNFAKVEEAELLSKAQVEQFYPISSDPPWRYPIILRLRGVNFDKATNVLLNGRQLEFSIVHEPGLGAPAIFAMVSENLATQKFTDLHVLVDSRDFSIASLYEWEFGMPPKLMSSSGKCVAQFVKVLLTSPGTDAYEPTLGAGLQKFTGTKVADPAGLLAAVTIKVINTVNYIKSKNSGLTHIPKDERLDSVTILSLNFDPSDPGSIQLVMKVNTMGTGSLPVQLMLGAQDIISDIITEASASATGTAGSGY